MSITPSSFNRDPAGYVFNQLGHMATGFGLVYGVIILAAGIGQEVPEKWLVLAMAVLFYLIVIEVPQLRSVMVGRRTIADMIEDTIFAAYGAGSTVAAFSSVAPHDSFLVTFAPVSNAALAWFVTATVHILIGAAWRAFDRVVNGAKVCGQNPPGEPRP